MVGSHGMRPTWIQTLDGMHPIWTEPELILVLHISKFITWRRWDASRLNSEFRWDATHLNRTRTDSGFADVELYCMAEMGRIPSESEFRWDASHLNRTRTDSGFADFELYYMAQMGRSHRFTKCSNLENLKNGYPWRIPQDGIFWPPQNSPKRNTAITAP